MMPQFCSHFAVLPCSSGVERKYKQVQRKGLFQLFQQGTCMCSQTVGPVDQFPKGDGVNCCSIGTEVNFAISVVEGARLSKLLRMSVSRRYIRP